MITTSVTVQITSDNHPLFVAALVNIYQDEGRYQWDIIRIEYVELQVGNKEGVDITNAILKKPRAKALIEAAVEAESDQIAEHIRDLRVRRVAI